MSLLIVIENNALDNLKMFLEDGETPWDALSWRGQFDLFCITH